MHHGLSTQQSTMPRAERSPRHNQRKKQIKCSVTGLPLCTGPKCLKCTAGPRKARAEHPDSGRLQGGASLAFYRLPGGPLEFWAIPMSYGSKQKYQYTPK